MFITPRELNDLLIDYRYSLQRVSELKEDIRRAGYKVTQSYGQDGGGFCGGNSSKVERFVIKNMQMHDELKKQQLNVKICEASLAIHELTGAERKVLEAVANGEGLAGLATGLGVGVSYVYKIRDRALHKASKALNEMRL